MTSVDSLVYFKIVLGSLYATFTILAFIQLIRVFRARPVVNNRLMLQVLLWLAPMGMFLGGVTQSKRLPARFVLMVIPPKVFEEHIRPMEGLQVWLDLLPEILFWQTYVALVLIWYEFARNFSLLTCVRAELYHFARNKSNSIER